jgi:hypothetical protein
MDHNERRIDEQQQGVLEQMGRIRVMRRGTLSQQEYGQRRERKGGKGATGPYFVWQGSVDGGHFSKRVGAGRAQRMREEIAQRKCFEDLCAQYVALGEQRAELTPDAQDETEEVKKGLKSRRSRMRK